MVKKRGGNSVKIEPYKTTGFQEGAQSPQEAASNRITSHNQEQMEALGPQAGGESGNVNVPSFDAFSGNGFQNANTNSQSANESMANANAQAQYDGMTAKPSPASNGGSKTRKSKKSKTKKSKKSKTKKIKKSKTKKSKTKKSKTKKSKKISKKGKK